MGENDKRIPREHKKKFDRFLFEDDFSEEAVPENDEPNTEQPDTTQEDIENPLTQEDLAQAESQGYTKGLSDGKEQAFEDYNAELKKHTEKLTAALQDIDTARTEITEDIKQKAFTLLEAITETLLLDARQHYPEDLLKQALEVLSNLSQKQQETVTIYTAPETKDFLTQTLLKKQKTEKLTEDNIKTDTNLQAGDCIVEWAEGGVDLRLDNLKNDIITTLQRAAKAGTEETPKESVTQQAATSENAENDENQEQQNTAQQPQATTPEEESKNEMN